MCLNFAHQNERVPADTAWAKLKQFKGTEQARIRWLDLDECRRLIDGCAADFRKIVQGGLLTGARWSELRRIRTRDYDEQPRDAATAWRVECWEISREQRSAAALLSPALLDPS